MSDETKKLDLVAEEVEVLTICYEKPGSIEDIASEMEIEVTEVEAILESLADKKLVKEAEGTWATTADGDFYIEDDKDPNDD
jgi:predicted transcriptional regulator